MIIIADSGSSKTDWCMLADEAVYAESLGLNPHFLSDGQLHNEIAAVLKPFTASEVRAVYFYGSGCGLAANKLKLAACFRALLPQATVTVGTDLEGAAVALFGKEKGIACILGTGANAGIYDGEKITRTPKSLGYILGDSGSGAVLGLSLLRLYLQNKLPEDTAKALEEECNVEYAYLLENVYRKERPNRFFASFIPFIKQHRDCPVIEAMLMEQFDGFIRYYLLPFPESNTLPVRITGSVAYCFQDILMQAAGRHNLAIDKIVQRPIQLLKERHPSLSLPKGEGTPSPSEGVRGRGNPGSIVS